MKGNKIERIAIPSYGHNAAMGYKFRCRIESDTKGFFKPRLKYRAVIERYFMDWSDWYTYRWRETPEEAKNEGNKALDQLEATPKGEYI